MWREQKSTDASYNKRLTTSYYEGERKGEKEGNRDSTTQETEILQILPETVNKSVFLSILEIRDFDGINCRGPVLTMPLSAKLSKERENPASLRRLSVL